LSFDLSQETGECYGLVSLQSPPHLHSQWWQTSLDMEFEYELAGDQTAFVGVWGWRRNCQSLVEPVEEWVARSVF
jgi:hypothetical protein